jgi:mono/diheme cytochrome c family protein
MPQEVTRRPVWLAIAVAIAIAAPVRGQAAGAAPPAVIPSGADGAKIFAITCAACHLASGLGTEGKVPPLAGSEWVSGSEGRLVRIVLHGLIGDVEVQGEVFNGAMPTWGGAFSDEQIASVLSFVRRSWGNKAPPITAETVARIRAATATRKLPWTVKELLRQGTPNAY